VDLERKSVRDEEEAPAKGKSNGKVNGQDQGPGQTVQG